MNVTSKQERLTVLTLQLAGNSLRRMAHITGLERNTISRIICEFGQRCGQFLHQEVRDLTMRHVQIDELYGFVERHEYNVKDDDPRWMDKGEMAFYVAYDEDSKLIPAHRIGKLGPQSTYQFIRDLHKTVRIHRPNSDSNGPIKPVILISSDGFRGYENPIKCTFGPYADYGQIVKDRIRTTRGRAEWDISYNVVQGNEAVLDEISTSLVERCNLSIRTFMAMMRKKSITFAKKLENLQAAANVFVAHYNYCWKHEYRLGNDRKMKTSPAHWAGLAPRRYDLEEFYDLVLEHTIPAWEAADEPNAA